MHLPHEATDAQIALQYGIRNSIASGGQSPRIHDGPSPVVSTMNFSRLLQC